MKFLVKALAWAVLFSLLPLASPAIIVTDERVPSLAYNTRDNTLLLTYQMVDGGGFDLYGRLYSDAETPPLEFKIADFDWAGPMYCPVVHDQGANRFMVVYGPNPAGEIRGQLINANGTLFDQDESLASEVNFDSILIDNGTNPAVAFDSNRGMYLVVWESSSTNEILGQFIDRNGSLSGLPFTVRPATAPIDAQLPALTYDQVNQRFLVVFYYSFDSTNYFVAGQFVSAAKGPILANGSAGYQLMGIGSAPPALDSAPAIAFNVKASRYLVAWAGDDGDLYGQLLNANASITEDDNRDTADIVISNAPGTQYWPAVINNLALEEFLVIWDDDRKTDHDIYGQRVDLLASAYKSSSERNFQVAAWTADQEYPALAYVNQGGWLISAFEDGTDLVDNTANLMPVVLPPSEPVLVAPLDGAIDVVGPATWLAWIKSQDPYGKKFWYNVYFCNQPDVTLCAPITMAAQNQAAPTRALANNAWPFAASMVVGLGLVAGGAGRSRRVKAILAVLAMTVAIGIGSCLWEAPEKEKTEWMVYYKATGLVSGDTYYWKVQAENEDGAFTETEIRSFTAK